MNDRCPRCGHSPLLEFFAPEGVALCTTCSTLLRRASGKLVPFGPAAEGLTQWIREQAGPRSEVEVERALVRLVAERQGTSESAAREAFESGDLDSLDIVELVMSLEEEAESRSGQL